MNIKDKEGVEFGSALDTLAWLVDIKGRDEHKEALRALNDALNDAARRLERVHDEADKYQVRALDAEAEVRRLRAKLARVEVLVGDNNKAPLPARWYGNMRYLGVVTACDEIRAALKDEP